MSLIHCNTPDAVALAISQWPDPDFPWTITDIVPGMKESELRMALEFAARQWQHTCGIKPRETINGNEARLLVTCRRIDSHLGVLAECELPTGQRRVRLWLDISETWNTLIPAVRAISLASVLWHEMGHAIGIGHAPERSENIMAPQLNERIIVPGIFDKNESQRRYGKPATVPTPPPTPTPGGNMGFLGTLLKFLGSIDPATLAQLMTLLKTLMEAFSKLNVEEKKALLDGMAESIQAIKSE